MSNALAQARRRPRPRLRFRASPRSRPPSRIKALTPETAVKAAQAALAKCRADGYQVSVAVVDRSGLVQVVIRDRYAGAHSPETATNKAWTAVSFRTNTTELMKITQPGQPSAGHPQPAARGGGGRRREDRGGRLDHRGHRRLGRARRRRRRRLRQRRHQGDRRLPRVLTATRSPMDRREFLNVLAIAAAAGLPISSREALAAADGAKLYDVPRFGNVSLLHMTDCHAQLMPIYFREPNVNLGIAGVGRQGAAPRGRAPPEGLRREAAAARRRTPSPTSTSRRPRRPTARWAASPTSPRW